MDFVCRMMERRGIPYYFQHVDGAHAMVPTDMAEAHSSTGARDFQT
jgi:type VI secretion system secreted protein VgrG